jgi:hypothetical protein
MNSENQPQISQELYQELEKAELKLQGALLDPRYGDDQQFTEQANSLKDFATNLRNRLRDTANEIFLLNNATLRTFLEEMGIHADKMEELREDGQIAGTIGSAVERALKIAHPLL